MNEVLNKIAIIIRIRTVEKWKITELDQSFY